jgi:hypothetical protein
LTFAGVVAIAMVAARSALPFSCHFGIYPGNPGLCVIGHWEWPASAIPAANGAAAAWNYYSDVPLYRRSLQEAAVNGIIYLIGLIVVVLAILSFFGLH